MRVFVCTQQGHPQGGCHSSRSPKEDPQQCADDEGTDEPDPVSGGLTSRPDPAYRGRRDKWTDGGGYVLSLIFPSRPPFFPKGIASGPLFLTLPSMFSPFPYQPPSQPLGLTLRKCRPTKINNTSAPSISCHDCQNIARRNFHQEHAHHLALTSLWLFI